TDPEILFPALSTHMLRRIYRSFRTVYIHNESALLVVGSKGRRLAFAFWREAPRDNLQGRSPSKVFGASLQKANASRERRDRNERHPGISPRAFQCLLRITNVGKSQLLQIGPALRRGSSKHVDYTSDAPM